MAEPETKPGETPTEQGTVTEPVTEQQSETAEQLRARLAESEKRIRELNRESADRRKKLEQYEADAQKKADAEKSELQKAQERLAALESEIKRRDLDDKKRAIAAKAGLPAELASRLVGATDEELEADAKALLAVTRPAAPKTAPVNPGAGGSTGETKAQQAARILGIDR